ncbi:MAG: caspase family protein [Myxococcales bacterium]|nr:caspase family protein [Myxococcales bacterium]
MACELLPPAVWTRCASSCARPSPAPLCAVARVFGDPAAEALAAHPNLGRADAAALAKATGLPPARAHRLVTHLAVTGLGAALALPPSGYRRYAALTASRWHWQAGRRKASFAHLAVALGRPVPDPLLTNDAALARVLQAAIDAPDSHWPAPALHQAQRFLIALRFEAGLTQGLAADADRWSATASPPLALVLAQAADTVDVATGTPPSRLAPLVQACERQPAEAPCRLVSRLAVWPFVQRPVNERLVEAEAIATAWEAIFGPDPTWWQLRQAQFGLLLQTQQQANADALLGTLLAKAIATWGADSAPALQAELTAGFNTLEAARSVARRAKQTLGPFHPLVWQADFTVARLRRARLRDDTELSFDLLRLHTGAVDHLGIRHPMIALLDGWLHGELAARPHLLQDHIRTFQARLTAELGAAARLTILHGLATVHQLWGLGDRALAAQTAKALVARAREAEPASLQTLIPALEQIMGQGALDEPPQATAAQGPTLDIERVKALLDEETPEARAQALALLREHPHPAAGAWRMVVTASDPDRPVDVETIRQALGPVERREADWVAYGEAALLLALAYRGDEAAALEAGALLLARGVEPFGDHLEAASDAPGWLRLLLPVAAAKRSVDPLPALALALSDDLTTPDQISVLKVAADAGIDLAGPMQSGSLLFHALERPETLTWLLAHGLAERVDATDRSGRTALFRVACGMDEEKPATLAAIDALLRAGADPYRILTPKPEDFESWDGFQPTAADCLIRSGRAPPPGATSAWTAGELRPRRVSPAAFEARGLGEYHLAAAAAAGDDRPSMVLSRLPRSVDAIALSPSGTKAAVSDGQAVGLWDVRSGLMAARLVPQGPQTFGVTRDTLGFVDEDTVYQLGERGLSVWSTAGQPYFTEPGKTRFLAVSPGLEFVVASERLLSDPGLHRLQRGRGGWRLVKLRALPGSVSSAAVSAAGHVITAGTDEAIHIWGPGGEPLFSLEGVVGGRDAWPLSLSATGDRALFHRGSSAIVVQTAAGTVLARIPVGDGRAALSPSGRLVLVRQAPGLALHDAATGAARWSNPMALDGAFTADDRLMYVDLEQEGEVGTPHGPLRVLQTAGGASVIGPEGERFPVLDAQTGEPADAYDRTRPVRARFADGWHTVKPVDLRPVTEPTLRRILRLKPPGQPARSLAQTEEQMTGELGADPGQPLFAVAGEMALVAGMSRRLLVHRMQSAAPARPLEWTESDVIAAQLWQEGAALTTATSQGVQTWRTCDGALVHAQAHPQVMGLAPSQSPEHLWLMQREPDWQAERLRVRLIGADGADASASVGDLAAFAPPFGLRLEDTHFELVDLPSGQPRLRVPRPSAASRSGGTLGPRVSLHVGPNREIVLAQVDGHVWRLDPREGTVLWRHARSDFGVTALGLGLDFVTPELAIDAQGRTYALWHDKLTEIGRDGRLVRQGHLPYPARLLPHSLLVTGRPTFEVDLHTLTELRRWPAAEQGHVWPSGAGPEARWFALAGGQLSILDLRTHQARATLSLRRLGSRGVSWMWTAPDGRFDTNDLSHLEGAGWQTHSEPAVSLSVHARSFYTPRLMAQVFGHARPTQAKPLDRRSAEVPTATLTRVEQTGAVAVVKVAATPAGDGGLSQVRVFRDAQLVAELTPAQLQAAGTSTLKIPLPGARADRPQARLTALAVNEDGVPGPPSAALTLSRPPETGRRPKAWLLTIGVSGNAAEALRLSFASPSARAMAEGLAGVLKPDFDVVDLRLHQDRLSAADAPRPTRAAILATLAALGGRPAPALPSSLRPRITKAHPDDVLIVYYAGHGDRSDGYHLVPSDMPADATLPLAAAYRPHAISVDALADALRAIDVQRMFVLVDACYAGQVGVDYQPGPFGGSGLAFLAYDKRALVVAATQPDEPARVATGSVLVNALLAEQIDRLDGATTLEALVEHLPSLGDPLQCGSRPLVFSRPADGLPPLPSTPVRY